MIMGRGLAEHFENPSATEIKLDVSPALASLLTTHVNKEKSKSIPQVSQLKRDLEIVDAQQSNGEQRCPDMSQYIRMDEIPCWNCTLP